MMRWWGRLKSGMTFAGTWWRICTSFDEESSKYFYMNIEDFTTTYTLSRPHRETNS